MNAITKKFRKVCKKVIKKALLNSEDSLATKAQKIALIRAFEEDGYIYISESGMDCDHVRYSGIIHKVKANWYAIYVVLDSIYNNAEGPTHCEFITKAQADEAEYSTRDLLLEAFEDGHPHIIYS